MKVSQNHAGTETATVPDLVAVEFICSGCGKTLPLVAPEERPECAKEAAMKLGWTFEKDEVTHGLEAFCSDCSGDRQRLSNEGGSGQAQATDSPGESRTFSRPCPD